MCHRVFPRCPVKIGGRELNLATYNRGTMPQKHNMHIPGRSRGSGCGRESGPRDRRRSFAPSRACQKAPDDLAHPVCTLSKGLKAEIEFGDFTASCRTATLSRDIAIKICKAERIKTSIEWRILSAFSRPRIVARLSMPRRNSSVFPEAVAMALYPGASAVWIAPISTSVVPPFTNKAGSPRACTGPDTLPD